MLTRAEIWHSSDSDEKLEEGYYYFYAQAGCSPDPDDMWGPFATGSEAAAEVANEWADRHSWGACPSPIPSNATVGTILEHASDCPQATLAFGAPGLEIA